MHHSSLPCLAINESSVISLSDAYGSADTTEQSWLYNWEAWKPANVPKNLEFVASTLKPSSCAKADLLSVVRTAADGPALDGFMKTNGAKVLMCLNEPDQGESLEQVARAVLTPFNSRTSRYDRQTIVCLCICITALADTYPVSISSRSTARSTQTKVSRSLLPL